MSLIRLLPFAVTAFTSAYLAWSATDYYLNAEIASLNQQHKEQMLTIVQAGAKEIERARDKADHLQANIAAIDEKYTKELSLAKTETSRLRDAVDGGNKRLHILARRPASCPSVPTSADDTSVDNGAAIELSESAQRAYFRLRTGIETDTEKLHACQAILKALPGNGDLEPQR